MNRVYISSRFRKSEINLKIIGLSDSDWGGSFNDRRRLSGNGFQSINEGPLVSWKDRKLPTVELSKCEAEYMALPDVVQEAKFLNLTLTGSTVILGLKYEPLG